MNYEEHGTHYRLDSPPISTYAKKKETLAEKGLLHIFQEMEWHRQKITYALQSPEQRKRSNNLARARMQRMRERQREAVLATKAQTTTTLQ